MKKKETEKKDASMKGKASKEECGVIEYPIFKDDIDYSKYLERLDRLNYTGLKLFTCEELARAFNLPVKYFQKRVNNGTFDGFYRKGVFHIYSDSVIGWFFMEKISFYVSDNSLGYPQISRNINGEELSRLERLIYTKELIRIEELSITEILTLLARISDEFIESVPEAFKGANEIIRFAKLYPEKLGHLLKEDRRKENSSNKESLK